MAGKRWSTDDIPDLSGRTAVVTGANSGLGFETSRALAGKGARVVMACRDIMRGQAMAAQIREEFPEACLDVAALDLADLTSVQRFAGAWCAALGRLDILCNNAGVMALPLRRTAEGFEMQFGTNHLGHFALTGLLLPATLAAERARVVTVSSAVHMWGRVNFEDLNWERSYNRQRAYAQSKLANLLFAYELQRRFAAAGCGAISVAAHPGYASTNLQFAGPKMTGASLEAGIMRVSNRVFAQSAEMGALPGLYAATAPGVAGGDYIGPTGWMGMRGHPSAVRSSTRSYDHELAARLWEKSEELTGVRFDLTACAGPGEGV